METLYKKSADLIKRADFLLICAGAGFSADSGLPIYNDIAKLDVYQEMGLEYHDLCDPIWLDENPDIFYGFWGDCFNMYRKTETHNGYNILKKWSKQKQNNFINEISEKESFNPFFIYSSNIDGHFHRHFNKNDIYEIHGNIEMWQCRRNNNKCLNNKIWKAPENYIFNINKKEMRAIGFQNDTFLECSICKDYTRPNILMFYDHEWIKNSDDEKRYDRWIAQVEKYILQDTKKKLVVLEIGCGTRVPSVRMESEMVVRDIFENQRSINQSSNIAVNAHLIRINLDFPSCNDKNILSFQDGFLSIKDRALDCLTKIDRFII